MCKNTYPHLESAISKVEDAEKLDHRIIFAVMTLPLIAAFAVIWIVVASMHQLPHMASSLFSGQDRMSFSDTATVPERIQKAEVVLKKAAKQGALKTE